MDGQPVTELVTLEVDGAGAHLKLSREDKFNAMNDQMIDEFPESQLAPEAKRISQALAKAGF